MSEDVQVLRNRAESARALYNTGNISREDAKLLIMPYIEAYNKKAKEIAKKYNVTPKLLNFASYVR